ncbi:MAG: hypothetical protein M1829_006577 [Trizodia sp. TS-e1964]|nr:MAG: hypothetical protein M1829_006577 [Trizodia sp. TS-e1964]
MPAENPTSAPTSTPTSGPNTALALTPFRANPDAEPLSPPPSKGVVIIMHPGFNQPLFSFQAFDADGRGIDILTATIACGLVTGNSWDGGFHGHDGIQILASGIEGAILPCGTYYFFPSNAALPALPAPVPLKGFPSCRYHVTREFNEWLFPHSFLPPVWRDLAYLPPQRTARPSAQSQSQLAIRRDGTCRITGAAYSGYQIAHLCPRTQLLWFTDNGMARYTTTAGIDCARNLIMLRADLHMCLDAHIYAFVPQYAGQVPALGVFSLVSDLGFPELFHGLALKPTPGIAKECFFARFSLAVFDQLLFQPPQGLASLPSLASLSTTSAPTPLTPLPAAATPQAHPHTNVRGHAPRRSPRLIYGSRSTGGIMSTVSESPQHMRSQPHQPPTLDQLVEMELLKERARSDKGGLFAAKLDWRDSVNRQAVSLRSPADVAKYFDIVDGNEPPPMERDYPEEKSAPAPPHLHTSGTLQLNQITQVFGPEKCQAWLASDVQPS